MKTELVGGEGLGLWADEGVGCSAELLGDDDDVGWLRGVGGGAGTGCKGAATIVGDSPRGITAMSAGIGASNWLSADRTAGESACVGVGKAHVGEAGAAVDCAAAAKGCAARLGNEYAKKEAA